MAAPVIRPRTTVALCIRVGAARMALTVDVDAIDVAGLDGQALHDAVYPAVTKTLEDLTYEVVELRED